MPKVLSAVVAGAVAATTVLATVPAANAEPTATPAVTDIVGAGSDTTQFVMQDLAETYNVGRTTARLASFDAKGTGLSATVVLKQGTEAITRPNGSGAGKRLLHGATNNDSADFARSSGGISEAEVNGGLYQIPFSVDGLKLAVRQAGTNAPATVSPSDLVAIYSGAKKNWNEIPGGKAGVIKPLIPQVNSGTRDFFISQLTAANGGNPVSLADTVVEVQEHDAAPVASDPNAVAPFSTGRFKSATGIVLTDGWQAQRALYNVVRARDLNKPWVADIFGVNGFICSDDAREVIEASGFEQLARPDEGGVCGEPVQTNTANFKTNEEKAAETTTTLTATASDRTVTLRASVAAGTTAAAGSVQFLEGNASRGIATVAQGVASLRLTNVAPGTRRYRAVFTPANAAQFTASSSSTVSVAVKAPVVKRASKVSVKVGKAVAGKRAKVAVTVRTKGAKATGVVRAFVGKKRVAQARVKAGRATFRLPKLKAGSVRLQVRYLGSPTVKASAKTVRVKVARAR